MFDPPLRCAYNQVVSEMVGSVRALQGMLNRSVRPFSVRTSAKPGRLWRPIRRAGNRENKGAFDSRRESGCYDSPPCFAFSRRGFRRFWSWFCSICIAAGTQAPAQDSTTDPDSAPGQFFTITEPITHETLTHIRAATRQLVDRNAAAEQGKRPILVFEFLSGDSAPGASEFGASYDLASLISTELAGAQAHGCLRAPTATWLCRLARDRLHEIVMGLGRELGPDHARGPERSMPPSASQCDSSPCGRRATPTSCSGCSTEMPTFGWCNGRQDGSLRAGRQSEELPAET